MNAHGNKTNKKFRIFCVQRIEKRPTDLKALFLHKVLSRRVGTIRFIRWSFFNLLEIFL
jgi:hypothetical protein